MKRKGLRIDLGWTSCGADCGKGQPPRTYPGTGTEIPAENVSRVARMSLH